MTRTPLPQASAPGSLIATSAWLVSQRYSAKRATCLLKAAHLISARAAVRASVYPFPGERQAVVEHQCDPQIGQECKCDRKHRNDA